MKYEELLANAPAHDSPEFLEYLRANNPVVRETKCWLIIENFKYHSAERPWHTAFHKGGVLEFKTLTRHYWTWEWLKKATNSQTVPTRFHMHFYKQ